MKKKNSKKKNRIIAIISIILGIAFLISGPIVINYMFITETMGWKVDLAFSAGDMLQYYGAILGGLVTCFAIISTIHINNMNRDQDRQRLQFERVYAIYHKLPEILAKLELAAIHVQYSVHLNEDNLMETLDTMKESEGVLREHHLANDIYYNVNIESLLKKIIAASVKCQENVESFLKVKKCEGANPDNSRKAMEDAFAGLREAIKTAKSEIISEINKFILKNDGI